MKSFVTTSAISALVCALSYAGEYQTGQAARMIIGQANFTDQLPGTTQKLLGAVGGVAFAKDTLIIADSTRMNGLLPQNRRIVLYKNVSSKLPKATAPIGPYTSRCPVCTGRDDFPSAFDVVLGQSDFTKSDPAVSQAGLRLPTAVATDGTVMAVADTENNRVLIWKSIPSANTTPADIVLGQANFTTVRQPIVVDNHSFRGPQGVWIQDGRLYVADTQNHRVLIWNSIPSSNNQAADLVLGQSNFNTAVEPDLTKITQSVHANTLLNPVSVTSDGKRLFVSDLGYSRVLIWNSIPTANQAPADVVVGQPDMETEGENNSSKMCAPLKDTTGEPLKDTLGNIIYPFVCERTLDFPRFALSDGTRLYISDTGNDRVLIFNTIPTANNAYPDVVLGQPDFFTNIVSSNFDDLFNPNLIRSASDEIPAPIGLAWDGENLYVTDPTDRRILVFSPQTANIARDGIRNAASLNVFAVSVVQITAAPKENDELTVTIAKDPNTDTVGVDYKYKAGKDDTIKEVINGIVAAINNSNDGRGDPYLLAIANVPFNLITLTARVPGDPGFAVTVTTKTSDGAQITVLLTKSNPTTQSAQRLAPGAVMSIFGKDLSTVTTAATINQGKAPFTLGGVEVYVDGNRAPLFLVSPTQINTQIPYEVLDTNSVSVYVRSLQSDGSYKTSNAIGVPITLSNPGIFAGYGDEPRVATAFHQSTSATITIQIDGSITANDTATVTIEDRAYTYTVVAEDTLATIRDHLIDLINANDEETLQASKGGNFTRIVLAAKVPGPDGNGIGVTSTVSTGANVILTTSHATTCCASSGGPITDDDPALPGEIIIVYATGLGIVGPDDALHALKTGEVYTGPEIADPNEFVSSLAGGRTANVVTAAPAIGQIGVYKVTLELNSDLPTNPQTQLTIAQNIYTSNIVTIPVVNPNPNIAP